MTYAFYCVRFKLNEIKKRVIMKFVIERTSTWDSNPPPDDKRVQELEFTNIDSRSFKTEKEHDEKLPNDPKWRSRGTNHRMIDGGIARDLGKDKAFFIDLEWSELEKFVEEHGSIVIEPPFDRGVMAIAKLTLEIYDGWRE